MAASKATMEQIADLAEEMASALADLAEIAAGFADAEDKEDRDGIAEEAAAIWDEGLGEGLKALVKLGNRLS